MNEDSRDYPGRFQCLWHGDQSLLNDLSKTDCTADIEPFRKHVYWEQPYTEKSFGLLAVANIHIRHRQIDTCYYRLLAVAP